MATQDSDKLASSGLKRVIVNADDFGFSPGVTEGILQGHRAGIITSTTVMANMPDAAEAIGRLTEVPNLGVGVHLNATQGRPLSKEGQALADDDGIIRHSAVSIILACCRRPKLIRAVVAEFDAQIRWVLDHSIKPTHLDSHRHTHVFTPIFVRVLELAKQYNVPFVRRAGEKLTGPGWPRSNPRERWTSRVLNLFGVANQCIGGRRASMCCPTNGTWGVAHTGCIDAAWLIRAAQSVSVGVTEIMTHPGLSEAPDPTRPVSRLAQTRPLELDALCDPAVREAFERNNVRFVHYEQL